LQEFKTKTEKRWIAEAVARGSRMLGYPPRRQSSSSLTLRERE
jgi:hypothetical protein